MPKITKPRKRKLQYPAVYKNQLMDIFSLLTGENDNEIKSLFDEIIISFPGYRSKGIDQFLIDFDEVSSETSYLRKLTIEARYKKSKEYSSYSCSLNISLNDYAPVIELDSGQTVLIGLFEKICEILGETERKAQKIFRFLSFFIPGGLGIYLIFHFFQIPPYSTIWFLIALLLGLTIGYINSKFMPFPISKIYFEDKKKLFSVRKETQKTFWFTILGAVVGSVVTEIFNLAGRFLK